MKPSLQALWLADHIEQDEDTGKVNATGVFDQIEVEASTHFTAPAHLFFEVRGIHGSVKLKLLYVDLADDAVLLERDLNVPGQPLQTAIVDIPLQMIPVPHAGSFVWEVHYEGDPIGAMRVEAAVVN